METIYDMGTKMIDSMTKERVMAGDVIVVPPSDAVAADRWVDQYIRQVLPFSTNAGAYYQLNNIGLLK